MATTAKNPNKFNRILPNRIKNKLTELKLTKKLHGEAVLVLSSMWMKHHRERLPLHSYTPISKEWILSVIGDYQNYKIMPILCGAGILQVEQNRFRGDMTYLMPKDGKKGVCQNIRINPTLSTGKLSEITLTKKKKANKIKKSLIELRAKDMLNRIELPFSDFADIQSFVNDFSSTPEFIASIESRISVTNKIPDSAYMLFNDSKNHSKIEKEYIKPYLTGFGLSLFEYKNKGKSTFYVSTHQDLFNWKLNEVKDSYSVQLAILNDFDGYNFDPKRNNTNNRLDSSLSNSMSQFLAYASVGGCNLMNIDIINSQFLLFGHNLKQVIKVIKGNADFLTKLIHVEPQTLSSPSFYKEILKEQNYKVTSIVKQTYTKYILPYLSCGSKITDCKSGNKLFSKLKELEDFANKCSSGKLYEYVASEMQVHSKSKVNRQDAKNAMFLLFFGGYDSKGKEREQLRAVLPTVVGVVDYMKREVHKELHQLKETNPRKYLALHPNKTPYKAANDGFSISLQEQESHLMIDKVLSRLYRRDIWSASKHDSILCLESDYSKVLKIIQNELDKYFGAGEYRLKKEWYTYDRENIVKVKDNKKDIEPTTKYK